MAVSLEELQSKKMSELYEMARELGIENYAELEKEELIKRILDAESRKEGLIWKEGVLEIHSEGFGFLRNPRYNLMPSPEDAYVASSVIKKLGLRPGDYVEGFARRRTDDRVKNDPMVKIVKVSGYPVEESRSRPVFEKLTPYYPTERLRLENPEDDDVSMRVVDLFVPVGKGQRGLIVAPPRSGKTVLLQKIAKSIVRNHPEVHLIILLIDERPEEVTDFQRVVPEAEIFYSTFDQTPERHTHMAELVLERAKRLVEAKKDVVILLDSLTRLTRAYNLLTPSTGKTLSGGIESSAFVKPKKFFGAARNIEEGGSLTILATALIETGSRMDEVIFEEFKGTGNMELVLSRQLAERRIFPAIDLHRSGTRKEELILTPEELEKVWMIRKVISNLSSVEAMELIKRRMEKYPTNAEFLQSLTYEPLEPPTKESVYG